MAAPTPASVVSRCRCVSYSDPFGLCPPEDPSTTDDCASSIRPLVELGQNAQATNQAVGLFASLGVGGGAIGAIGRTLFGGGTVALGAARAASGATAAQQVLKGPIADAVPRNLPEQIALRAARAGEGAQVIMRNLGDESRLVANYGQGEWVKMQTVLRGLDYNVTVHWFRNLTTSINKEFKFK